MASINIELFVHGVPYGQKIWGQKGKEEQYLSSFYGPKWDAEVMKIDVKTFVGDVPQCYYSFIKGQNVCDSDGRSGGYFALTVRINAFYADVQNMYNILKAIYDKICVGLCVQEKNGTIQFLRSDFQSIDGKLKQVKEYLLNYLSLFSTGKDIVPLNSFTTKGEVSATSVNLLECTKSFAVDQIRKSGKLMVSAYYPTSKEAKTIALYQEKMQAVVQQAQQEIQLANKSAQEKIDIITRQSNERIDSLVRKNEEEIRKNQEMARNTLELTKNDYERRIEEIKRKYADADVKMDTLKHSISKYEKEIEEWKLQCNEKDRAIHKYLSTIQTLQQEVSKTNNARKTVHAQISEKDTLISKLQQEIKKTQQEVQRLRKEVQGSQHNSNQCVNGRNTSPELGTTKSFSEVVMDIFLRIRGHIVRLFRKDRKNEMETIPQQSVAQTVPNPQQPDRQSVSNPQQPVIQSVQNPQQPVRQSVPNSQQPVTQSVPNSQQSIAQSVQSPQQPFRQSVQNNQDTLYPTQPKANNEDLQTMMRNKGLPENTGVADAMDVTPQDEKNTI